MKRPDLDGIKVRFDEAKAKADDLDDDFRLHRFALLAGNIPSLLSYINELEEALIGARNSGINMDDVRQSRG